MTELNYQFICEKQDKEIKELKLLKKIQVAINQAQAEVFRELVEAGRGLMSKNTQLEGLATEQEHAIAGLVDDLNTWVLWGDTIVKEHKELVEKLETELGMVKFSNEEYRDEVRYLLSENKVLNKQVDRYYNERGWWQKLTAYLRGE